MHIPKIIPRSPDSTICCDQFWESFYTILHVFKLCGKCLTILLIFSRNIYFVWDIKELAAIENSSNTNLQKNLKVNSQNHQIFSFDTVDVENTTSPLEHIYIVMHCEGSPTSYPKLCSNYKTISYAYQLSIYLPIQWTTGHLVIPIVISKHKYYLYVKAHHAQVILQSL